MPRFGKTQVVEAQIRRKVRLDVTLEKRFRLRDIRPLGKSLSPPGIVLRGRMELRKVMRDDARLHMEALNVHGGHR